LPVGVISGAASSFVGAALPLADPLGVVAVNCISGCVGMLATGLLADPVLVQGLADAAAGAAGGGCPVSEHGVAAAAVGEGSSSSSSSSTSSSSSSSPFSSSTRKKKKPRAVFSRPKRRGKTVPIKPPLVSLPPPPPSPSVSPHTLLRTSIWPEVRITSHYNYLGVPIGACVTPDMIYDKAMDKIRKKFHLLGPSLRKMSVQKRIITVNVFILSLLSYVNQLVRMPDAAYVELRKLILKHTTPWNGTAWGYNFLVVPCANGGFPTPINDPWVTNVMALLRRVEWDSIIFDSLSWEPNMVGSQDVHTSGIWENSVKVSDNVNLAIVDFLGPLYFNWDKVSSLASLSKTHIKHSLIKNGFLSYPSAKKKELTKRWGRDYDDHIYTRLGHFGVASFSDELKKHYKKPVKNPYLYENHLKIITNSLATARRRRVVLMAGSDPGSLPCCSLCSLADDGVKHLFFDCLVVIDAMALVARNKILDITDEVRKALFQNKRPLFLPISPDLSTPNFSPLLYCMAFCRAVIDATERVKLGIVIKPAATFIMNATIRLLRPPSLKTLLTRQFGNASRRTPEQKKLANEYAKNLISKIPTRSTILYTDGSARPNPGPAGAGCLVQHPVHLSLAQVHLYASIGAGTNNLGEAWAIGMGLSYFFSHNPTETCVILTDSELCIRALKNGFSNHPPLNTLIQRILSLLRENNDCFVKLLWVPGHVNVSGNVIADRLANIGARNNRENDESPEPFSYLRHPTIDFPPFSSSSSSSA
jgi:ribonuclease HI